MYEDEELYTVIGTEDQLFISILKTYNNDALPNLDLRNMIDNYKNYHGITNLEPKDITDLYLNHDGLVIKSLTIDEIFN